MTARMTTANPAVLSYYTLRRTVGIIAMSLPFVLAAGTILLALAGPPHALPRPLLQRSISDYYYTPTGDVLVGSLCSIAAFLICSRGYDLTDEVVGYIAGCATLGVAFFPPVDPQGAHYTQLQVNIGFVHSAFSAVMFLALAYFCLFLFRRTSPEQELTRRKWHRNKIYRVCGFVIVVCTGVMALLTIEPIGTSLRPFHPFFCCETLALEAFGISWFTKGRGLLKDLPNNHARIR